nr:OB-fold nucleic acid binding domain-containing protein [Angustibacter aerolatus]
MLGLYVSDHPLFGVEHVLAGAADCSIASFLTDDSRPDGSNVTISGMISGLQRKMTKNGNPWAIATVEDLEGAVEVLFFPQTYQTVSTILTEDLVVVVRGRVNRRDEVPTIYAAELTVPDLSEGPRGPVVIAMPVTRCTPPVAERLKDVLATHPGVTEVHLRLTQSGRETVMRLDDRLRVTAGPALFGDLKQPARRPAWSGEHRAGCHRSRLDSHRCATGDRSTTRGGTLHHARPAQPAQPAQPARPARPAVHAAVRRPAVVARSARSARPARRRRVGPGDADRRVVRAGALGQPQEARDRHRCRRRGGGPARRRRRARGQPARRRGRPARRGGAGHGARLRRRRPRPVRRPEGSTRCGSSASSRTPRSGSRATATCARRCSTWPTPTATSAPGRPTSSRGSASGPASPCCRPRRRVATRAPSWCSR